MSTRISEPSATDLASLYKDHSLEEISKLTGISVGTIGNRLRGIKIKMRPRGSIRGRFKHPDVKTEDLLKAFTEGHSTISEIARRFGVTRPTVAYRIDAALAEAGSPRPRPKRLVDLPQKEIVGLYLDHGLGIEALAKRYGAGETTIWRLLKAANIPLRTKSDYMKDRHAQHKQKLAAAWRPKDWWKKPIEWRIIGGELLSRDDYMSNDELAERLDASRSLRCPFGSGNSWKIISQPGRAANFISDIRKWVNRPGKPPVRK